MDYFGFIPGVFSEKYPNSGFKSFERVVLFCLGQISRGPPKVVDSFNNVFVGQHIPIGCDEEPAACWAGKTKKYFFAFAMVRVDDKFSLIVDPGICYLLSFR